MFPIAMLFIPFFLMSVSAFIYRKMIQKEVDLKNKIILITGASFGVGKACAKRYLKEGAKVVMTSRNVAELNRVKEEFVGKEEHEWPVIYKMDVTNQEEVTKVIKEVEEKHGPIDVLLCNAGSSQRGSVNDTVLDVHQTVMNVNYFGSVNTVKAVLPSMLERKTGHIISIGSALGKFSIPYRSAYCASKHASQAFFDSLRAEVAQDNIYVTVVNPTIIKSENFSQNALNSDGSKYGAMHPSYRTGMSPSFVANYVCDSTTHPDKEVPIEDNTAMISKFARLLMPPLFFKFMEWKAVKDGRKLKKDS